jgi:hypothetical protein
LLPSFKPSSLTVLAGCPIPYAPLLLNAPDTFRELRVRQATNMNGVLWWPCPQVSCATGQVIPTSEQRNALVSGSACPCLDPLLQKELNAALEDTLSSQMSPPTIPEGISCCSMPVKTSITHPLKFVIINFSRTVTHNMQHIHHRASGIITCNIITSYHQPRVLACHLPHT